MSLERVTSSLVSSRSFFGLLCVAATLALTSPGVQIARAADDVASTPVAANMSVDPTLVRQAHASSQPPAGPSCSGPTRTPSVLNSALLDQQTRSLQREILRRANDGRSGPQSPEDGIVLNGRGYNYQQAKSARP